MGTWKNRTDSPFNLIWKNDNATFLGVFVGNRDNNESRIALANLNLSEIEAKITNKLAFWKGLGLPIKAKIRVVNMSVLSKLYYRLEIVDITSSLKAEVEKKEAKEN